MKNKTILIIMGIFLMGIVVGQITTNLTRVELPAPTEKTSLIENITFMADGNSTTCQLNEPDNKIDFNDIQTCIRSVSPNAEITDIKDSKGNFYVENETFIGFEEKRK